MLTKKELEVLKLKKRGLTQIKIAKKLGISQPAVSGFYNNALKKIKDASETIKLKKHLKLGQGAIEFMVLFGFALFFFITFFGIIQSNIGQKNVEKEKIILQNVALTVRDEINLAAGSSDGYYREFKLPGNILGRDYEISITDNFVNVSMDSVKFSYKISNVTGSIQKRTNNITKQNGITYLNK